MTVKQRRPLDEDKLCPICPVQLSNSDNDQVLTNVCKLSTWYFPRSWPTPAVTLLSSAPLAVQGLGRSTWRRWKTITVPQSKMFCSISSSLCSPACKWLKLFQERSLEREGGLSRAISLGEGLHRFEFNPKPKPPCSVQNVSYRVIGFQSDPKPPCSPHSLHIPSKIYPIGFNLTQNPKCNWVPQVGRTWRYSRWRDSHWTAKLSSFKV